jgi:hypothetical protein
MSELDRPRFPLWCLFAFVLSSGLSLGLWNWLGRVEYVVREERMPAFAVIIAVSPLVFGVLPRPWLRYPRALFFHWLPWPGTALVIAILQIVDERSIMLPPGAMLLAIASFFTIFTPTIIVGIRRNRAGFDSPDRGGRS